jgi:hypothetical protein
VEYGKAVETELNALVFSALRRALARKGPPERETRVDGRPLDLGRPAPHQTLGVIRTLLQKDSIVQQALPGAIPQDGNWILGQLSAEIEALVNLRNPSAHSSVLGRDPAVRLRDGVLGVGVEGLIARIARARMRSPR